MLTYPQKKQKKTEKNQLGIIHIKQNSVTAWFMLNLLPSPEF